MRSSSTLVRREKAPPPERQARALVARVRRLEPEVATQAASGATQLMPEEAPRAAALAASAALAALMARLRALVAQLRAQAARLRAQAAGLGSRVSVER